MTIRVSSLVLFVLLSALAGKSLKAIESPELDERMDLSATNALDLLDRQVQAKELRHVTYWIRRAIHEMYVGRLEDSQQSVHRAISAASDELRDRPDGMGLPCFQLRVGAMELAASFMLKEAKTLLLASEEYYELDYTNEQFLLALCLVTWDLDLFDTRLALRAHREAPSTVLMKKMAIAAAKFRDNGCIREITTLLDQLNEMEMSSALLELYSQACSEDPELMLGSRKDDWAMGIMREIPSLLKVNAVLFEDATAENLYQTLLALPENTPQAPSLFVKIGDYFTGFDWVARLQLAASEKEIERWPLHELVREAMLSPYSTEGSEAVRLAGMAANQRPTDSFLIYLRAKALLLNGDEEGMERYLEEKETFWTKTEHEDAIETLLDIQADTGQP